MRLALIIDDYLPQSTRVGAKMFHELAQELVTNGHDVTVITPCADQDSRLNIGMIDSVNVWRFKSGKIKDVGRIERALNETLLSFHAWRAIKNNISENTFDGIIYYSPSIFFGNLVRNIKEKCCCPAFLVLRDFFPQWVIDAGMIKGDSLIAKYFRFFEKLSYDQASIIGLQSERNLHLFESSFSGYSTVVTRNWSKSVPASKTNGESFREKLGLQDKVIYFYGGNIGHAQDMANLMRLAKRMAEHENAHFLFVGQGDEVELINDLAKQWQLKNFSYLPSVDQNTFKQILADVDIGLFSLSQKHTAHNFPGKLLGYMVESLPILGSVNEGNDLLDLVNSYQAGFIYVNGEDDKLYQAAADLYHNAELRRDIGKKAYDLLVNEFSVHSISKSITESLEREYENC